MSTRRKFPLPRRPSELLGCRYLNAVNHAGFPGETSISPGFRDLGTVRLYPFGRGALQCGGKRALAIKMPNAQNPPEKMKFQLTLRRRGISDQGVLRAMDEIPREVFVEAADRADAYRDSALGIACGQTISQPFVVAYMTEQLQLQKHHRVLEIGTGSGYQAAILSRLCGHVLTIERYRTLADSARARLRKLGCYNVEVMLGDGFDIPESAGNFDRIIVTAALERIPEGLTERLEPGGILIAPVGPHHGTQTLVRLTRTEAGLDRKELVDVRFVPALPGIAREL
jgi:protein-L-isoaspartate(D-aspartate) O-methyltransferase